LKHIVGREEGNHDGSGRKTAVTGMDHNSGKRSIARHQQPVYYSNGALRIHMRNFRLLHSVVFLGAGRLATYFTKSAIAVVTTPLCKLSIRPGDGQSLLTYIILAGLLPESYQSSLIQFRDALSCSFGIFRQLPLAAQMTGFAGDEVGATNEGNCGECYIVEACVLAIVEDGQIGSE
jgi:hypothetical protein